MVIQIPNPLLLPQSYGMGEVAGMSFGSNYVIMMQIGYRYYAPRIIEEMEKNNLDHPMGTVWWNKWQKFMLTYSDQSIKNTMDRTLDMPDKTISMIWDKLSQFLLGDTSDDTTSTLTSASQLGKIESVRYIPSHDLEADRKQTERDLLVLKNKMEKLTNDILTQESLADAKKRQDERNRPSDEIPSTGTGTLERTLREVRAKAENKTFDTSRRTTGVGAASIAAHQASLKQAAKPRAPKSIVTQVKKLNEEIRSLSIILGKLTATSTNRVAVLKYSKIRSDVRARLSTLQRKYKF